MECCKETQYFHKLLKLFFANTLHADSRRDIIGRFILRRSQRQIQGQVFFGNEGENSFQSSLGKFPKLPTFFIPGKEYNFTIVELQGKGDSNVLKFTKLFSE
jgi:hypothetical protein